MTEQISTVSTKAEEVSTKSEEVSTKTEEVSTKAEEVSTKAEEVSTKSEEVSTKSAEVSEKDRFIDFVNKSFDEIKSGALNQYEIILANGTTDHIKSYEGFLSIKLNLLEFLLARLNPQFTIMWARNAGLIGFDQMQRSFLNSVFTQIKDMDPSEGYKKAWEDSQISGKLVKQMYDELLSSQQEQSSVRINKVDSLESQKVSSHSYIDVDEDEDEDKQL